MVRIAIKPKYPTRKATDKVLFNDGNFVDCIDEHSTRQLLSLLDTAHVALISEDGKYYPVDKDNYEEQYKLADAGETPTVEADEKFGVKKMEEFITAPTDNTDADKIQEVSIYNGIIAGQLMKVTNYLTMDDERFDKNGYWLMFNYDKTAAEKEGYSNAHLLMGDELADGSNLIYFGESESLISNTIIAIESTLTVDDKSGDNMATFTNSLTGKVLIASDDEPYIAIGDKSYDTLAAAIASAKAGETVVINKSISVNKTINITNDTSIKLQNNAVVTINGYIMVKSGTLNVTGEGTIKEIKPYFAPIIVLNQDENNSAEVYIGNGITLWGWAGLMFDAKSVNINATCYGHLIGNNDGSDDGAGFYCNGNVKEGSFNFYGSTEGTVGHGLYIAGNLKNTISGANIEGTQTGLEIRAGSLDISNSKVISLSSAEPAMVANGNGTTSTAVGLAVAQHTTKKDMTISINNCTLSGPAAFMEGNPQNNPDCTKQMNIAIAGNTVLNGKVLTLDPANDCKNFVYESRCSVKPDDAYIAKGYEATETFTGTFDIAKKQ